MRGRIIHTTMAALPAPRTLAPRSDVVVVGAGVLGLGHAVEAVRAGLQVTVVDAEERLLGASVRGFGHACVAGQPAPLRPAALDTRERWLDLGARAGFWVGDAGTLAVARGLDELAVLTQLRDERDGVGITMLDADDTARRLGPGARQVVGGALLTEDVRIEPRHAVPALAAWLAHQPGVRFLWSTHVHSVTDGLVQTSRGDLHADHAVICLGHDLDRLLPDVAAAAGLRRCRQHMLRLAPPDRTRIAPAVITGLSMLRQPALAAQPAADDVRRRIAAERPELVEHDVDLVLAQRPDGDLVVGDTHDLRAGVDPFSSESLDRLLLDETARLLGVPGLHVKERWLGVHAEGDDDVLVHALDARTTVVSATHGVSVGLGLAADVVRRVVAGRALPAVVRPPARLCFFRDNRATRS
ncbi:MAG: TIGR03364 family FAD-dependent oxidoreductase [Nocardioides sp.]|nr:TIGR03364 family FAD-dependent oxidoreductase [Nocardioides sp.]